MHKWTGAEDEKDPVVVAYNGLGTEYKGFVKIFNGVKNAAASVWNGTHFNAVKSHQLSEKYVNNYEKHSEWYSLWVDVTIPPYSSAYIKISEDAHREHHEAASSGLTLRGFDGPEAHFGLVKSRIQQNFTMRLAYYHADDGDDKLPDSSNAAEGAYLLKPEKGERRQLEFPGAKWSLSATELNGDVDQYTMMLKNKTDATMAVVKMRFFPASGLVEADVTTLGIDYSDGVGKDIIVNFKFDEIDANKTFYTDSNGLEMQERILDYRPTWDLHTDQNISSNYYPVDTAIAMRDKKRGVGVTVMNDRSQGGSAELIKGNIELIQSRRMLHDDDRGVAEALDEWENSTDPSRGVIVNARYWIDVYDVTTNSSQQRKVQLQVDQPVQLYYALDYSQDQALNAEETKQFEFLGDKGAEYLKMLAFPLDRNKIMLRLENLYDVFDGEYPVEYIDLNKLAVHLY